MIIGIAGGTGSGKTTVARRLADRMQGSSALIEHDSYYRDQSTMTLEEREKINFDHPDALETELLVEHLEAVCRGETIEVMDNVDVYPLAMRLLGVPARPNDGDPDFPAKALR